MAVNGSIVSSLLGGIVLREKQSHPSPAYPPYSLSLRLFWLFALSRSYQTFSDLHMCVEHVHRAQKQATNCH